MNDLTNVDLCAVDGSTDPARLNLLINIATHCCEQTKFNSVKIFTGCDRADKLTTQSFIKHAHVKVNSIESYNRFVINNLHEHVQADFCLIFQHDGFIINPGAWTTQFMDYDYVGAVFPKAHWNHVNRVGNGGFSLRSREFMKYCARYNVDQHVNEDVFLCINNYHDIVSQGFRFAPARVASRFSIEEITEYNDSDMNTFGFHGSSRRPHLHARTLDFYQAFNLNTR